MRRLYIYVILLALMGIIGCASTPSVDIDLPPVEIQPTTNAPPVWPS